jgi:DNA-binding NarL/FixJ family response regulator
LLTGVKACLSGRPGLDVRQVETAVLGDERQLQALSPDVLIFDLDMGNKLALDVLKPRPGLLLIGLDLDSSQVVLLSGRQHLSPQAGDLVELIRQNLTRGPEHQRETQ